MPGVSFRAIAETQVAILCWLYLHSDENIRKLLSETLAPWRGIVTLLSMHSSRYLRKFSNTGHIRWARFALAAIGLLGDNADYRDDSIFLRRIALALAEHDFNPAIIFRECGDVSVGQAKVLFRAAMS